MIRSLISLFVLAGFDLFAAESPPAITVGPYLVGLGQDQVTVCWRTAEPGTGTVEYSIKGGERREAKSAEAATSHRVTLRNLLPGTEVRYRVLAGGQETGFFRFTTAPAKAAPFRFAVYGDSGGGGNPAEHERIAKAILSHRPAFVVHAGDFVPQGDSGRGFPAEFFLPAGRELLAECPILPVPGDNDRKAMGAYAEYFGSLPKVSHLREGMPGVLGLEDAAEYPPEGVRPSGGSSVRGDADRAWFTWTYGDLQLFMLNSNEPLAAGTPQGQWLADALAASRARWKVAVLHHPFFSSGPHGSQHGVRRAVMPLFLRHGVDLVLAGHDHIYERSYALAACLEPTANAFVEIVTAGGGNRLYPIAAQPWSAHAESRHHFCVLEVDADKIRGTAFSDAGEAFDRFVLCRRLPGGKEEPAGRWRYMYRRHPGGTEEPEGVWETAKTLLCDDAEFIANAQRLEKFWFPPLGARPASKRFELHLANPFDHELRGDIAWEIKNPAWAVEPAKQSVALPPHGEAKLPITAAYTPQAAGGPQPVPMVTFSSGGLKTTVAGFSVQEKGTEKAGR